MSDLALKWNSLSKNEQSYFMQQQAGARQSQNLAALLSNFKGVQEATALAYNSSGSAAAENAKVLESLDAKTTALKATWQDFANKTIDSELVKSLLNLANGALKILNTDVGRMITQVALLSGAFTGLGGIVAQVLPAVIKSVKSFTLVLSGATTGVKALTASIPVIGILLAAFTAYITKLISAYQKQNEAVNELRKSLDDANDTYEDAITTAAANEMQAKSLVGTIEELNKVTHLSEEQQYRYESAVNKLNELYPDLNLNIDKHTGKIKEDTDAIYDRIEAMKQEAVQAAVQEKRTSIYGTIVNAKTEQYQNAERIRAELLKIQDSFNSVEDLEQRASNPFYWLVQKDIESASADEVVEWMRRISVAFQGGSSPIGLGKGIGNEIKSAIKAYEGAGAVIADAEGELSALEGTAQSLTGTLAELNKEKNKNADEKQLENADDLKKAYEALDNAISDYGKYQQLQAKTQEELNVALPGVIDYLYDENGALTDAGKSALAGSRKLADFAIAQKEAEVNTKKATLEFLRQASVMDLMRFDGVAPTIEDMEKQIDQAEDQLEYLKLWRDAYSIVDAEENKSSSKSKSTISTYKKAFTDWLAYKDHQLAMDEITEEQYYAELTEMVDKFFKGRAEYQEEYWQYSEKIYAYEKKRMQELVEESTKAVEDAVDKINEKYDSELSRLEEVNDALSDQIEYEKLLDEMAKAREQKKLVYKDGRFQYVQDVDAISAAQAKLDEYSRNKGLEASKADIEARRKAEVRQTILDKMQANSAAWATSTSPAEREALHNANVELAKLLEDNSTYDAATGKWSSYAGGTLGAAGGMSLVGENGPEMRILNRGDGILTSGVTKNLFAWGSTSPSDFVSALKGLMGFKLGNSSNTTVNVNNLELPNVTNAREFVTGLKNLALQYAYERG